MLCNLSAVGILLAHHSQSEATMSRYSISDFWHPLFERAQLTLAKLIGRSRVVWVMILTSFLLSGCVQCDVGIQFDNPNRGRIVQHIQVEERLKTFSGATIQQWLDTIEQRSRNLGGQVTRRPGQALVVIIPFTNNTDLERKFNHFFDSSDAENAPMIAKVSGLPKIDSHLTLKRSNFLLIERNRLRYDLDLRSLGVLSSDGNLLISPGSLINLEFRLKTPWGARSVASGQTIPQLRQEGGELIWQLVPGEINHLEAVFWLPSSLGIGTLVIVLLVLLGTYLKYPQSSTAKSSSAPQAADSETGIVR